MSKLSSAARLPLFLKRIVQHWSGLNWKDSNSLRIRWTYLLSVDYEYRFDEGTDPLFIYENPGVEPIRISK